MTRANTLARALDAVTTAARRNTEVYRNACAASVLPKSAVAHVNRFGPGDVEPLTRFHSSAVPGMTIAYMFQLLRDDDDDTDSGRFQQNTPARHVAFDDDTGLIAVTLMLRYQRMTGLPITTAMLHRLFLTAVLVASKTHHDLGMRNDVVGGGFGVSLAEMNLLERQLLSAIDYRAAVFAADVVDAVAELATIERGRLSLARLRSSRRRQASSSPRDRDDYAGSIDAASSPSIPSSDASFTEGCHGAASLRLEEGN